MKPEVGMKATHVLWSDSHAYTIIEVNKAGTKVTVQRDRVEAKHKPEDLGFVPGGFVGHCSTQDKQEWETFPDPQGSKRKFSLRKNGRWCEVGDACTGPALKIGYGIEFYDYNF
ncbi:MAG: hypothetical protein M0R49_00165 [Limnochordia bacterium]|nr:hypothetical protein [Limnochordia bacterium]